MSEQAETLHLQSEEWVRVRSYDPKTSLGMVSMASKDEHGDAACVDLRPAEARVLAGWLLRHADRAEGR